MGIVNEVFTKEVVKKMEGFFGIGHVRYSTNGFSNYTNAEPLTVCLLYTSLQKWLIKVNWGVNYI